MAGGKLAFALGLLLVLLVSGCIGTGPGFMLPPAEVILTNINFPNQITGDEYNLSITLKNDYEEHQDLWCSISVEGSGICADNCSVSFMYKIVNFTQSFEEKTTSFSFNINTTPENLYPSLIIRIWSYGPYDPEKTDMVNGTAIRLPVSIFSKSALNILRDSSIVKKIGSEIHIDYNPNAPREVPLPTCSNTYREYCIIE